MSEQSAFSTGMGIGCGIFAAFVLAPIVLVVGCLFVAAIVTPAIPTPPPTPSPRPAAARPAIPEPAPRDWTDEKGQKFRATFAGESKAGVVSLRKADGTVVTMSCLQLCPADREWLIWWESQRAN